MQFRLTAAADVQRMEVPRSRLAGDWLVQRWTRKGSGAQILERDRRKRPDNAQRGACFPFLREPRSTFGIRPTARFKPSKRREQPQAGLRRALPEKAAPLPRDTSISSYRIRTSRTGRALPAGACGFLLTRAVRWQIPIGERRRGAFSLAAMWLSVGRTYGRPSTFPGEPLPRGFHFLRSTWNRAGKTNRALYGRTNDAKAPSCSLFVRGRVKPSDGRSYFRDWLSAIAAFRFASLLRHVLYPALWASCRLAQRTGPHLLRQRNRSRRPQCLRRVLKSEWPGLIVNFGTQGP